MEEKLETLAIVEWDVQPVLLHVEEPASCRRGHETKHSLMTNIKIAQSPLSQPRPLTMTVTVTALYVNFTLTVNSERLCIPNNE
jgi:hypothetical protein